MSTPAPTPTATDKNKRSTASAMMPMSSGANTASLSDRPTSPTLNPLASQSAVPSTSSAINQDENKMSEFTNKLAGIMNGRTDPSSVFNFMTTVMAETSAILLKFNPADFENFGMMNSHVYRNAFIKLVMDSGLSAEEFIMVIALFTAVKNKVRVEKAMVRFNKEGWFKRVQKFVQDKIVQYTSELDEKMSTFAAVHIPNIMPSITLLCWIKITKPSDVNATNLLRNLWACQLDIPVSLKEEQKIWEKDFWTSKVTHTRNTSKKRDAVVLGFHEDFWNTKAQDSYPLILPDGKSAVIKDKTDLDNYILEWLKK